MMEARHVLMVVTSHDHFPNGHPTGLWLEEFAVPYVMLQQAGYSITVASPSGGAAPVDPRSMPETLPASWKSAINELKHTQLLDTQGSERFQALILPGGHGPMFDLSKHLALQRLLSHFAQQQKIIGALCHGPAALVSTVLPNGRPLVAGHQVTGFSNQEERMVELDHVVPFLLQNRLQELGGHYSQADPWQAHVVADGFLLTGQNPQSSEAFSHKLLDMLAARLTE